MKIKGYLFFLSFMLLSGTASGQPAALSPAGPGLRIPADTIPATPAFYTLPSVSLIRSVMSSEPARRQQLAAPRMPSAYSYQDLGAFCKWEVQLERAAHLPVKVRLGEVQYVERMEGKMPDY